MQFIARMKQSISGHTWNGQTPTNRLCWLPISSQGHSHGVCVLVVTALALAGCGTADKSPTPEVAPVNAPTTAALTGDFSRSKLIAADFVATMSQLPESRPSQTLLHTNKPSSRFGELLLSELQGAGFDLRIGDADSQHWLAYNANREETPSDAGNPVYTFIVAAGNIKLKRSYEVDQYGVRPAGNMFVRGANPANIVMDESIFNTSSPGVVDTERNNGLTADSPLASSESELPFSSVGSAPQTDLAAQTDNVSLQSESLQSESLQSESLQSENVQIAAVPAPEPLFKIPNKESIEQRLPEPDSYQPEPVVSLAQTQLSGAVASLESRVGNAGKKPYDDVHNFFESGQSQFNDVLINYDIIDRSVYVFPDDSLVLGTENKNRLQELVQRFNSDTDLMSVVGCSHGSTKIENGNAYLANNRAIRVMEELVRAGLQPDKVLAEGCWASVAFPEMPARGVLVELRRIKS